MITPFKTTNNLTVTGNVTASNLFYDISGNSSQWNTAYRLVSGGISSGSYLPLSGGTLTGSLSTTALSTSNIFSYGNETILSDGVGNDDLGNGANTLSLNFAAGVYIGGSGSLTLSALSATVGTFSTSVSAPAISGIFYGDGSKLSNLPSTAGALLSTLNGSFNALNTNVYFNAVSATSLSGTHYGDGSKLLGIVAGPYSFTSATSSTTTIIGSNTANNTFSEVLGGNCNLASGTYSTIVNGFSSCATGYATFVGAGSGIRATGNYAVAVGGQCNTASGCYSVVAGGINNFATGARSFVGGGGASGGGNTASAIYSIIVGGKQNCISGTNNHGVIVGGCSNIACTVGSANYPVIVGGQSNRHTYSAYSFIGGGNNNCTCSQFGQSQNISYATVVGGNANAVTNNYSIIGGGLGNYNPLRDSQIVGGVANHTGGYAPSNFVTGTALSGNGSCTCICGTNIQNCFSYPFTSNNISVYYATAANPLSAGTFSTATIAATGTNYVILNTDYSACSNGLSATSLYVYDRAINNTGYDNFIGGGKLNTASGCYSTIGGGLCNYIKCCSSNTISGGVKNTINADLQGSNTIGGGSNNTAGGQNGQATVAGGTSNTASGYRSFVGGGENNTAAGGGSGRTVVAGGGANSVSGAYSAILGGGSNCISGSCSVVLGGRSNCIPGCASTIVGGRYNYNPLYNSDIHGGAFNHTGGYTPANITFGANLSGNGACTVLCSTGIGSCFSNSGTTGAVSLMWMTSGTANSVLSSACYTTANVVTNAANCIIINGDYSTCSTGFSACSVYVYDRCLNQGGCSNFIGGGVLNTASGTYGVVGGGSINYIQNGASHGVVVGGCCNFINSSFACYATIVGGLCNVASAGSNFMGGGRANCSGGGSSVVVGGVQNCACGGNYNSIVGGNGNLINCSSANYSFIGGGYYNYVLSTGVSNGMGVIGGGRGNCLTTGSGYSGVLGGCGNIVSNIYSAIVGGGSNINSGAYSFVAGGSANDTKGFANTFILGTALSAIQANYTYVNNLSTAGTINGQTNTNVDIQSISAVGLLNSYTLALSDNGAHRTMTNTVSSLVIIPAQATISWPNGANVVIEQNYNAGFVQLSAASGVTLYSSSTLFTRTSSSVVAVVRKSQDTWLMYGDTR